MSEPSPPQSVILLKKNCLPQLSLWDNEQKKRRHNFKSKMRYMFQKLA